MIDFISNNIASFGDWLKTVLPTSPFRGFINEFDDAFSPFLGYLNYFIPISDFLTIFSVFLGVVTLFYIYSVLLRWIKAL